MAIIHVDLKEINTLSRRFKGYRVDLAGISSIAAAKENGITTILTDDLELRKAIESSGFQPVGTIGIIIKAYKKKVVADKKSLLQIIDALFEQSSLYVSPAFRKFTFDMVKKLREISRESS
ncbi:MAG: hypothetical protein C4560_02745 [Nitrospiraceae bacterium]|nr:MAG: hypothetical protein C4560_02745 [Nitrospiraceae bacterium]